MKVVFIASRMTKFVLWTNFSNGIVDFNRRRVVTRPRWLILHRFLYGFNVRA